jgi:hypothetical protein
VRRNRPPPVARCRARRARNPATGGLRGVVATDYCLREALELIKTGSNAGAMRVVNSQVASAKGCHRHAYRRRDRCIPARPVSYRSGNLTSVVDVGARPSIIYEHCTAPRILTRSNCSEDVLRNGLIQAPMTGQLPVPGTDNRKVVIETCVLQFLAVVSPGLDPTEWLREREHRRRRVCCKHRSEHLWGEFGRSCIWREEFSLHANFVVAENYSTRAEATPGHRANAAHTSLCEPCWVPRLSPFFWRRTRTDLGRRYRRDHRFSRIFCRSGWTSRTPSAGRDRKISSAAATTSRS